MEKIALQIIALSNSESSPGNFVVVLEDGKSKKRLPIIIGQFEAQAIAIYMEKLKPPRPLTHDLFAVTLLQLGASLKEIFIHAMVETVYISSILLTTADGNELKIDARTSDALALAIRFNATIYIDAVIFNKNAIGEIKNSALLRSSISERSIPELEILLAKLLKQEDYEAAAKIRDIILLRSKK